MGDAAKEAHVTFAEAARLDPDTHPGELDEGRWVPVTTRITEVNVHDVRFPTAAAATS